MSPAALAVEAGRQRRGVGLGQALQDWLPAWAIDAFAAVTHLGDAAVLLALAALVYLAYDRRAGAFVVGVLFVGFAVTIATKAWFAWPRPPTELQYVTPYGLGFPSGHAVGSTVGWGALALTLDQLWTLRHRLAFAGVVVVTVALSRVVIGVHYLADVVAGVAIGLAVLWVAARWLRDEPLGLFGLAGGLAVIAVAVSGAAIESVLLLGACIGALTGWQLVEPADRPFGRPGILAAAGSGVLLVAGGYVLAPTVALAVGVGALSTVGGLVAPVAREQRGDQ